MRRMTILLGMAAAVIGMVALAAALWSHSALFLANTWRERLEQAPENQVDDLLDRLADLGEAALPALADALASSRPCVAQGAARVLRSQPRRWQGLEDREATRRYHILAKALAEGWPRYGPSARGAAADIVAILLSRSPPEECIGDAEFLAACAEMLRSGTSPGGVGLQESASAAAARGSLPNSAVASRGQAESHSPQDPCPEHAAPHDSTFAQAPSLPEDAFPREPAPMPETTGDPLRAGEPAAPERPDKGATLRAAGGVGANSVVRKVGRGESPPETQDEAHAYGKAGTANGPRRLSLVRAAGFDDHGPHAGEADAVLKSAPELRQLAQRFHDQDPQQAETASRELKRCGLSAVELELARQLTHPDAIVRKALVRALPGTAGVDAAPWLLELSRDADADVRLEAITLLATTGDPALLEQLQRLVQADTDERIQRLSDRLARPTMVAEKKPANLGGGRK